MRALIVSVIGLFASACATTSGPVASVTIRNETFTVVKVLTAVELTEFTRQWQEKIEVEVSLKDAGGMHFKLDVEREPGGGRWLYYTSGYVSLLAHNHQPVYKLPEPVQFNKLIGAVE